MQTQPIPGTQEYWAARIEAFSLIATLKDGYEKVSDKWATAMQFDSSEVWADYAGDPTLSDDHWADTPLMDPFMQAQQEAFRQAFDCERSWRSYFLENQDNSMLWSTLWAQRSELLFILVFELLEGEIDHDQITFCSHGKLRLGKASNLNISLQPNGQFVLSTPCLWNAQGEDYPLLTGKFPEVVEQAKKIILANTSIS